MTMIRLRSYHLSEYNSMKSFLYASLCFLAFALTGSVNSAESLKTETELETITKCIEDLASDAVDIRKRAILVLGKYSNPLAVRAVIAALSDDEANIRRSALISLTEKRLPREAASAVLLLLADPDVHIRRITSSYLPQIMRFNPLGRRSRPTSEQTATTNASDVIVQAFQDDDATVRKNMVSNYRLFRNIVSSSTLASLLRDSDRDVRILAVDACEFFLAPLEFVKNAEHLVNDDDQLIRLRLAQILATIGTPAADPVLSRLAASDDFEISTEAILGFFSRGDFERYPELRARLDDSRMNPPMALKIIKSLPRLKGAASGALLELVRHPNHAYRKAALEAYARVFGRGSDPNAIADLLDDDSKSIREIAGRIMLHSNTRNTGIIRSMSESRFPDTRSLAITLSRRLPADQADSILSEVLLDENNDVRLSAIEEITRRQLPGWQEIVRQSFDDDDVKVRQRLLTMLSRLRSKEAADLLKEIGVRR